MNLRNWFRSSPKNHPVTRSRHAASKRTPRCRLAVERLEDRTVPSAVSISISDVSVVEGAAQVRYIDDFVSANSGGLFNPHNVVFGPNGDLYVASGFGEQVLRYDGQTGAVKDAVITSGASGVVTDNPWALAFGPDNKLYVAGRNSNNVLRYDPATGVVDEFISAGSGVWNPKGLAFGADGNLYVSNADTGTTDTSPLQDQVVRYQGPTGQAPGQFIDVFIARGDHGLDNPNGLTFNGNYLYVANTRGDSISRYDAETGAFHDVFVSAGSGGLNGPEVMAFKSGYLYLTSQQTSQVLRYDGGSGAFVDAVASAGNPATDYTAGFDFDASGNLYVGYNQKTSAGGGAPTTINDTYKVLRYGPASGAAFTVTLSAASASDVTVDYQTADGTATAGSDYVQKNSYTLKFAPGVTTRTILVPTLDDAIVEPTETFTLNLSNAIGANISDAQGVASIQDNDSTKFYVVNDASTDQTYRYGAPGNSLGNSTLGSGDTAPRGAASTAAGTTVWVVDANKTVYVYNNAGALLGSWTAGGLNSQAQLEGIATNGADIWLIDNKTDKVFKYTGAASRLSGSQSAASSFSLASGDTNGKGIVTDGTYLWVVDDGTSSDKVYKYTVSGTSKGSWAIDTANSSPTGLTIDPSNVSDIWIVDSGTKKVYQYTAAASRTSGSQSATATFALAAGNTNPQDIADPPTPDMLLAPAASLLALTPPSVPAVNAAPSSGVPIAAALPSMAGRDAVFIMLARESLQSSGVPSIDFMAGGAFTTHVGSSAPAADGALALTGAFGGQKFVDQPAPLTPVTSQGLGSEREAVGLLDSAWANEESQPSAATDAFFALLADDASAAE